MNRKIIATLFALACTTAAGQQVYRCDVNGQTVYTDAPCIGAQRIDATPSQGFDTYTGKSRKGKEASKEYLRRLQTEITRPTHGMTYEQLKPRYERAERHLTPKEHAECELLDQTMATLESTERDAKGDALKSTQKRLFNQRKRYRELKC